MLSSRAYLSKNSSKLSLVRIYRGLNNLFEGDGYGLKDNVEAIVGCEGVQGSNDVMVLSVLEYMKCLLSPWLREYSHIDKLNWFYLPNRHLNRASKFKVIDLLVLYPWRLPYCPEPGGHCYWKSTLP